MEIDAVRIIISVVGLVVGAVNVWGMFIIRSLKEDNRKVEDKCATHKGRIDEKIHQLEIGMHEKFVSKEYLQNMKKEMNDRFDKLEKLLTALIQK